MTFAAGTRIGSYVLQSLIGVGGMGEVYRAPVRESANHTRFIVVDAPHGGAQTFRVLTNWRP
jgi:hypothetical protein